MLKRSGYAGEGFFSPGKKLGTNVSHNLPPHLARQKALEAAEKRRQVNLIMSGGGRLGGPNVRTRVNKSPRELAAEVQTVLMRGYRSLVHRLRRLQKDGPETRRHVHWVQSLSERQIKLLRRVSRTRLLT